MKRYLAVRVDRPRRGYARLVRLRDGQSNAREFTTLQPGQTSVTISVYQVDERWGRRKPRSTHIETLRIDDLTDTRGRDHLTIRARYDGATSATLDVVEAGRRRASVRVAVDAEPVPWLRRIAVAAVVALAIGALGFAVYRIVAPPSPMPQPARDVTPDIPAEATGATDTSDTAVASDTERPVAPATDTFTLYFSPDSTELDATAARQVAEVAERLSSGGSATVTIVGHAAAFGSDTGRTDVSRGRALAVADALRAAGSLADLQPDVDWRGAREPVTRDLDRQSLNRRVVITVSEEGR
jgi:outer membrane protein OmpA-like peptidoglycan-associated protein